MRFSLLLPLLVICVGISVISVASEARESDNCGLKTDEIELARKTPCQVAENCWFQLDEGLEKNTSCPALEAKCVSLQNVCDSLYFSKRAISTDLTLHDLFSSHSIPEVIDAGLLNYILELLLAPLLALIKGPCLAIYQLCLDDAAVCLETRPPLLCDGYENTCNDFKKTICEGKISLDSLPDFPILDLRKQCDWLIGKLCGSNAGCKKTFNKICNILPGGGDTKVVLTIEDVFNGTVVAGGIDSGILDLLLKVIEVPCLKVHDACLKEADVCLHTRPPTFCDGYRSTCEDFKQMVCYGKFNLQSLPDFPILGIRKQCFWLVAQICEGATGCNLFLDVCKILPGQVLPRSVGM